MKNTGKKSSLPEKKKILHLVLSPETHKSLRVLAAHHDLSMTGFIEMVVEREVRNMRKEYMGERSVDGAVAQGDGKGK